MTEAPVKPPEDSPAHEVHLSQLAQLHRMSRTAGLGSSEYTAVNTTAVVAVILGLASGLALVTPIFLLLPIVGLVTVGVAIVQIRGSGGTQTGMVLAMAGLVLCVAFACGNLFQLYKQSALEKRDVVEMTNLVQQFGQNLADRKFAEAYALTDPRFREQVPEAKFESFFKELSASPNVGNIRGMRTNDIFRIEMDPETEMRQGTGIGLLETDKLQAAAAVRGTLRYRHTEEGWRILSLPDWFAPGVAAASKAPAEAPSSTDEISPPTGPIGPPAR